MSTMTAVALHPQARILRVSVPASLLSEYDDLALDYLQAAGRERLLRRRGERLVSLPFSDDRYGREVIDYLSNWSDDVVVTDITDEFEFFEVAGVPEVFLDEPFIVIVERSKLGTSESTVAIRKSRAGEQVAMYRHNGCVVRAVPVPRGRNT